MNFFDDDFGLGSTPTYTRKQSVTSVQYVFHYLEKVI